jgi:hypothetical protein
MSRPKGLLYRNGLGDKQDYAKAMSWFRKAADQGDAKAQMNVGWLYEHGLGVHQDCAEAATWYRLWESIKRFHCWRHCERSQIVGVTSRLRSNPS